MARTKNPARRSVGEWQPMRSESLVLLEDAQEEAEVEMEVGEEKTLVVQSKSKSKSTYPSWTRFPLALAMSLSLSSMLYTASAQWTAGELASVSKKQEGWAVLAGLLGWRGIQVALGWFSGYDSYDLLSLVVLSASPPLFLLNTFYDVSKTTVITSLAIDAIAIYIPFRLLRPVSPAHKLSTEDTEQVPNQDIVTDYSIKAFTTILAAIIYSTTLYASYATFLPTILVTHFNDIPTVAPAFSSTPISLLPMNLILGLAAHSFIFTPATALPREKRIVFDPVTATLAETIWYNLWGWSARTKMIIKRTTALAGVVGVNGWLQVRTVAGVESIGALVYSSVWATAGLIVGFAFDLVGAV